MFGFDGELSGIESILTRIAMNNGSGEFTHKEVRAYARCILKMLPELSITASRKPQIQFLLAVISAFGMPHYDRSFAAQEILKLLALDAKPTPTEDMF
jgi:hypothetical protein